jgi:hypothetical protein
VNDEGVNLGKEIPRKAGGGVGRGGNGGIWRGSLLKELAKIFSNHKNI